MVAYISRRIHLYLARGSEIAVQEAVLHPYLFIVLTFLLCPVLMIGALLLLTAVVMVPVSWMMGWL